MKPLKFIFISFLVLASFGCKIQYGFTQPSSINAETYQVNRFENTSLLFEPGLDLLTITVKVNFYNRNNEEDNIENKTFSFFYDYPGSAQLIGAQKTTAHEEIFDRLTQDIVNATLARW